MKEESSWVDRIEENLIAVILGTMALLTFANVVARYVFNSNIFWALELTVFLFAWLVLLDANLPTTEGRWFPIGFDFTVRGRGWYETQDIPVPFFMRWLETVFNDGMEYEKLPKVVPYFVMPLSMALLLFRFIQAGVSIWKGKMDMLIVSHEAEEEVEEANKAMAAEEIK